MNQHVQYEDDSALFYSARGDFHVALFKLNDRSSLSFRSKQRTAIWAMVNAAFCIPRPVPREKKEQMDQLIVALADFSGKSEEFVRRALQC
jgi:hypothetical protein